MIDNQEATNRDLLYKAEGIKDLYYMQAESDEVIDGYWAGECHSNYDSFSNT